MRIDNLTYSNIQTQGAPRREWLRQHSPQHLEQAAALIQAALHDRSPAASRSTLVLGAGACTEIPLTDLARASDEVVLADFDLAAMQHGRDELASPALRRKVRLLQCDLTGGVSANLQRLISHQPWQQLASQGARTVFDAAAACLEQCPVPDPPQIEGLYSGEFGLVISSLVLTQLFSYPLLDLLDAIQHVAPNLLGEQERHHHYQEAAQSFRTRIIQAHLNLLHELVDAGGLAVLLSDIRGFAFNVYGTDHDARHRRSIPLVPRATFDLVRERFSIKEEAHWEWLADLPQNEKPGRGYEVVGYILSPQGLHPQSAIRRSENMTLEENKALIRRVFDEALNAGNLSLLDQLFASDFVDNSTPEQIPGPQGVKDYFQAVRTGFPDMHVTIDDLLADEDKVVVRTTWRGTHQGTYDGITPTGRTIIRTMIQIFRVANGKIQEEWSEGGSLSDLLA